MNNIPYSGESVCEHKFSRKSLASSYPGSLPRAEDRGNEPWDEANKSPPNTPGQIDCDFSFRDKVTISDHIPYNFTRGNDDSARKLRYFNAKTIERSCHAKDGELTTVVKGDLIAVAKNFRSLLDVCIHDKVGNFCCCC